MPIAPIASRGALIDDLEFADTSLGFQTILVISGVIALFGSRTLRNRLAANLCGQNISICQGLKIKIFASVIAFVILIYFLWEAQYVLKRADNPTDCLASSVDLMGSWLVLLSAGLKLYSLVILFNCSDINESEAIEIGELPVI